MNCTICNGPGVHMGTLGNLDWYRCRDCGNQWSEDHEDEQEDED